MALPVNAPKVNCTLSKPLLGEGTAGTIKSASLKIDRDLVWASTGETMYKEAVPTVVESGTGPTSGTLSFQVIPVDSPGMLDTLGNAVTNWVYTLRVIVLLPGNVERTVDYNFQPLSNQMTYDLDLVAHANAPVVPPVITPAVIDGGAL